MSKPKHNYSQYSSNKNDRPVGNIKHTTHERVETPVAAPVVEAPKSVAEYVKPVVETVETVALPTTVEGVVVNCAKLNVRSKPDISSDVVCVLDVMSEMEIDVEKSNEDWFYVCTAIGVEGYCMRRFVDARL